MTHAERQLYKKRGVIMMRTLQLYSSAVVQLAFGKIEILVNTGWLIVDYSVSQQSEC